MPPKKNQAPNTHWNGRNAYPVGGFARVPSEMYESQAFQGMRSAAYAILMMAIFRNYSSTSGGGNKAPNFTLSYEDLKKRLGFHRETVRRAMKDLIAHGFLEIVRHGGLDGVNGVASLYRLSSNWKSYSSRKKGMAES